MGTTSLIVRIHHDKKIIDHWAGTQFWPAKGDKVTINVDGESLDKEVIDVVWTAHALVEIYLKK